MKLYRWCTTLIAAPSMRIARTLLAEHYTPSEMRSIKLTLHNKPVPVMCCGELVGNCDPNKAEDFWPKPGILDEDA